MFGYRNANAKPGRCELVRSMPTYATGWGEGQEPQWIQCGVCMGSNHRVYRDKICVAGARHTPLHAIPKLPRVAEPNGEAGQGRIR